MTTLELNSGKAYQATIDSITAVQAANALSGSKVVFIVTDASDNQLVGPGELRVALGTSAYNTIGAAALTSLNTALTSAKSTAQTALTAL